jgi:phage-related baseplate assembly protein
MAADHHRIGAIVPTDAIIAAGRVRPTVKMHLTSPTADVDPGADGAAWCTGIALETEIVDV